MSVSLPDPMHDWVQARVDSGEYADAGDYLRDLIRRDQADARSREQAIIDALIEGEQSGISERSVLDILAAVREETQNRA